MGMKGRIKDLGYGLGGDLTLTLSLPRHHADSLKKLMDCEIDAEIQKLWKVTPDTITLADARRLSNLIGVENVQEL